jgi:hypothetical protein
MALRRPKGDDWIDLSLGVTALGVLLFVGLCLAGCAVGTTLDGNEAMLGISVGDANAAVGHAADAAKAIGNFLPEPFGTLVVAGAGLVTATIAGRNRRKAEDAAFDEGTARAAGVARVAAVTPPITAPAAQAPA